MADRPQKENPRRVRITVGSDRNDYPFEVSARTADLTTVKLLLNSVISTPGARFYILDIKDYYLNTLLPRKEYMRIPINYIPKEIFDMYNLKELVYKKKWVIVEISKTMYGLKQAGLLANQELKPHLKKFGYYEAPHTPGLFRHQDKPTMFSLIVDDFGIKAVGREDALLDCEVNLHTKHSCDTG